MKKFLVVLAAAGMLLSCSKQQFKVEGTLNGAPQQYIYLEHSGLLQNEVVDSALLKESGFFSLKAARPEHPELYRLRVGARTIVLAVDSLETIEVQGTWSAPLDVTFSGSPKSEAIAALRRSLRDSTLQAHKELAKRAILADPASLVAYYALFQQKQGEPVFRIDDKQDRAFYQAVATSWNTWQPEHQRTKVLYAQVLEQINMERRLQNQATMQEFINSQENAFLDIVLPNQNGDSIALSSLRGKVILLDFCSMEIDSYQDYLFSLRDRYNAYHDKGLEIYQVYPDRNKLVWEHQVANLPWTAVRTDKGVMDQVYRDYNIMDIPTIFLYDRKGEISGRYVGFSGLNAAIEKLL